MPPSISSVSSLGDETEAFVPASRISSTGSPIWDPLRSNPAITLTSDRDDGPAVTQRLLQGNGSRFIEHSVTGSVHDPRPGSRKSQSHKPSWFHDWWLWEIMGSLLGLGATIAIIIMLGVCDGEPLRNWPSKVTPNASLSVLSTIFKVRTGIASG